MIDEKRMLSDANYANAFGPRLTRYAKAKVLGRLGTYNERSKDGEPVPQCLIGARILAIGAPDLSGRDAPEGGGLVIDFESADGTKGRYVFGFNECAMWIDYQPSWAKFVQSSPDAEG